MAAYCRKNLSRYGRELADNQLLNTLVMGNMKSNIEVAKYTNCNCIAIMRDVLKKDKKELHFLYLCSWVHNFLRNTSFVCWSPLYLLLLSGI